MIKEYINAARKGMSEFDKVWGGIKNEVKSSLGTLPEDEQEIIAGRRLICRDCPFNSSNAVSNPTLNFKTDRLDEFCIMCQCNLQLKTASLESECGIAIWNQEHPEKHNQLPLKWEAYKKPNENG